MFPPGITTLSFSEGYKKYFEIVPALSKELKWENYHLRHEVYCRDLGFEPERSDEIETDDYDRHSLHCLIRAVTAQIYVGCARIVLTDPEDMRRPLPFEEACVATLDRSIIDPMRCDRRKIAEISRLAVLGRYRRRKGESTRPIGLDENLGEGERLRLPYLTLGLYLGLIAIARHQGIETLFVLTEPRLAAGISRLGVDVQQIGGPIEHRGTRIPSMMNVKRIIKGLNPYVRPFFNVIAAEVEAGMNGDPSHGGGVSVAKRA
ncbi:MAG: PEP-CTERM/exosortase system-associated acyltransferase [Betaproteobacteria bacterium]